MLIEETTITLPGGKLTDPDISIDLEAILLAERRQDEVANVTPIKAPELLACFNGAWRDVDRIVKKLTAAKIVAERDLQRRRSKLILEDVGSILDSKGITSTKDTRDAVVDLDPEYSTIQDHVDQITAAAEFLKGKLKSFENAFTSVKKIMGEDAYNMQVKGSNPNLKHGAEDGGGRPVTPSPSSGGRAAKSGWGTPRFDR